MRAVSGTLLACSLGLLGQVVAVPTPNPATARTIEDRASGVTVSLSPSSTVIGSSSLNIESFRGIPYAQPPTGQLRLKPPVRLGDSLGTFNARNLEPACPQMLLSTGIENLPASILGVLANLPIVQEATNQKEDCLTLNVFRPSGTKEGDKLPVLFWIYGGAFELGWTSMYDPTSLLNNAIKSGKPFIFVPVNYRVGGFGFMPGKEILEDGSGNLGLQDQRMGLQWVADNIAAFGGDPDKVTIWGESAGAISVFDHMVLYEGDTKYKGKPLFRAAIMDSGTVVPADPVDCPKGQEIYDSVVQAAGCGSSSDTLACLRETDYTTFLNAANSPPGVASYNSVALSYLPRPDGRVLTDSPEVLVQNGKFAAVPMIVGDQEDEGTIFALSQFNTTGAAAQVNYLRDLFFHGATKDLLTQLVDLYGSDGAEAAAQGSPFGTGLLNELYPGFKRLAALLGDLTFTLTRRAFLTIATGAHADVPAWSYLASYDRGTPFLGTFHASDLLQVFYGVLPNYASKSIQSYYFNFVYNLDPNDASGGTGGESKVEMDWPQWAGGHKLMQFFNDRGELLDDNFRGKIYDFLFKNIASFHI